MQCKKNALWFGASGSGQRVSRWRKNRIPSVDPFTSVPSITRTTLLFIHTYTCNRLISSQALYLLIKQKYYQLHVAFPLKFQAKNLMLENEHQMLTLVLSPLVLVVPPKTIPAPWGELPVATRKNTKAVLATFWLHIWAFLFVLSGRQNCKKLKGNPNTPGAIIV